MVEETRDTENIGQLMQALLAPRPEAQAIRDEDVFSNREKRKQVASLMNKAEIIPAQGGKPIIVVLSPQLIVKTI